MRLSYLPRWRFSDSCGQPRAPGTLLCGCADHSGFGCNQATRRKFLATGVAIAGAGGLHHGPRQGFESKSSHRRRDVMQGAPLHGPLACGSAPGVH